MVVYSIEQRVFMVRTYWVTNSFKQCQSEFRKKYGVRDVPSKSVIQKMVRKLETTGSLIPSHGGGRPKMSQDTIDDVQHRLQQTPSKPLRRLAQETGRSYSTCQRAAKRAKLHGERPNVSGRERRSLPASHVMQSITHTLRTSATMSCLERHVIWKAGELEAYLHPSPWTPGATVVTYNPPRGASSLFHLPEDSFLSLLLGARAVGSLLCERLGVQRCALVHTPQSEEHEDPTVKLLVLPLHGLQADWTPHLAAEEDFQPYDPGYITSKSGPRWTDISLEWVKDRIRAKLPSPDAPLDYTFLGDPSHPGLFSRIVRGEEQQWRVWEDEEHISFLTPFPNTPGLTVLIPRKPLTSDILRLEEGDYKGLVLATRQVAQLLEEALGAWGVGLIFEGYEIDYAHAKLIPLVSPPDNMTQNLTCPAPEFYDIYPGFVTSASGPLASTESLRDIHAKITQV
ncbi:uncharacterized protein LOC118807891 isoform X1 [Colossoma macropomum]|uniref:uncharacterized protein LOC118807891 isoform X1 n=1 Tax=Colossoma macropomum TaxID=42526 RepID=UPI001863E1EE|nr:uncharacterized protein LOC118807891 isoform X1 [Colossoma macropomum]